MLPYGSGTEISVCFQPGPTEKSVLQENGKNKRSTEVLTSKIPLNVECRLVIMS